MSKYVINFTREQFCTLISALEYTRDKYNLYRAEEFTKEVEDLRKEVYKQEEPQFQGKEVIPVQRELLEELIDKKEKFDQLKQQLAEKDKEIRELKFQIADKKGGCELCKFSKKLKDIDLRHQICEEIKIKGHYYHNSRGEVYYEITPEMLWEIEKGE